MKRPLAVVRGLLLFAVGAAAGASAGPALAGCAPLSGGVETFPTTLDLVLDDQGFGEPYVVRLSSAGHPDAVLERDAQLQDTIAVELVDLELSGFHPLLGTLTLRESATQVSVGQITEIALNGACQFSGGSAALDLFVDLEVDGSGETWIHALPLRLEVRLTELPIADAAFEVPAVSPVPLVDLATSAPRGSLLYVKLDADPPFPPPGATCFDALWTATLQIFNPATTSNLFGFGPARVERGTVVPGGTCNQSGLPCDSDSDCTFFDTCKRPRIDTELVQLDLMGFDTHLGAWSLEVLPAAGTSDCCTAHGSPGCSDTQCQSLICGMDAYCCEVQWDMLCAGLAETEPSCAGNCLDPEANPTVGRVTSVDVDRTFPAVSYFDTFLRLQTNTQGILHNAAAIHIQPLTPIRNLPEDLNTNYVYGGPPKPISNASGTPVGQISNIVHTPQAPRDCDPPPAAGQECLDGTLDLEWTLPPCPTEALTLAGPVWMLRDAPRAGSAPGQDAIDSVLATAEFSGTSACAGPLSVRLAPDAASSGSLASLTPEEFFPADATFAVHLELTTASGVLTAGPAPWTTSINAVPLAAGEIFHGPTAPLALLDVEGATVGSLRPVAHGIQAAIACPAGWRSTLRFAGPTRDDFDVAVPGGGAGVDYDVVRGSLAALRANGGTFAEAQCLVIDGGPAVSDVAVPPAGDGYYYVSRDGLGALNGSWNSAGSGQSADRDPLLPDCSAP